MKSRQLIFEHSLKCWETPPISNQKNPTIKSELVNSTENKEVTILELNDSNNKMSKCQHCVKFIPKSGFLAHIKACKMYFKFVEKTEKAFKCKICPFETKVTTTSTLIYSHVRSNHQDVLNSQGNSEPTGMKYFF